MKCLSIKQPYADLIPSGKKTIENRRWATRYRGEFLIHASSHVDKRGCRRLDIDETTLVTGADYAPEAYYEEGKTYGWVLISPQTLAK